MDLKIQCHCGTKYKFEFQPVDGRIPFPVVCPTCGIDATEFANSRVQEMLGAAPEPTSIAATTASPPVATASSTTAAPRSRLKVRGEAPPDGAYSDAGAGNVAPPPRPAPAPMLMPQPITPLVEQDLGLSPRYFMGILGGLVGVLVGCLIWYAFFHFTGKNFRIVAAVVGIAAGFGTKIFSKDLGRSEVGWITGVFVVIGIVFTAYVIGRDRVHGFVGGVETELYSEQVAYAKRAVASVPNGTEQEIRLFLAKEEVLEDEQPDPAEVDRNEVRLFRDVRLAHYKELAAGKIAEKDYFKVMMRWVHEESVAEAKHAVAMMPNGTDREIRAYLAEKYADYTEEGATDPNFISAEAVTEFRNDQLPELKALANGERPFEEDNLEDFKTSKEALSDFEKTETGGWMKFLYFFSGFGLGGFGILVLSVGLSYKICTHAD